jgi:hypothetical protein
MVELFGLRGQAGRRVVGVFFALRVCGVLQGFLGKTGGRTWCFDGEFVVECVVKLVS